MGLLNTMIEVCISGKEASYYENLGYEIPRTKNKKGNYTISKGTKILVSSNDLPKHSGKLIEVECDCCKKHYKIIKENYEKTNHNGKIYCKSCAKKIFNSNINNPNYKPELTDEEREQGRFYPGYIDFIKIVLARDNYTCQCCKRKRNDGVKLNVHHLDGYNWCIEKRTDDANGITLCESCHSNFHSIYGNKNNTKEQFEIWFGQTLDELKQFDGKISSARKVYCYEEDYIYFSVKEFCKKHNLKSTTAIYQVCNNKYKYNTVKGFHLFWYDEYINMTQADVLERVNHKLIRPGRKNVICINTKKIYESISLASKDSNVHKNSISSCCNHRQENTYSKDGKQFQWMFLDEYLQQAS